MKKLEEMLDGAPSERSIPENMLVVLCTAVFAIVGALGGMVCFVSFISCLKANWSMLPSIVGFIISAAVFSFGVACWMRVESI